jgi:hypothetical protein
MGGEKTNKPLPHFAAGSTDLDQLDNAQATPVLSSAVMQAQKALNSQFADMSKPAPGVP